MLRRLTKSLAHSPKVWRLMDRAESLLPPLRVWHRAQYQRHFQRFYAWERLFSGVYPTREAALAAIPQDRPVGYDNPEAAEFLDRPTPMLAAEYPILFWLTRLLPQNPHVFDLGGNHALAYNWYKPYEIFPPTLRWTIYDVPAVVASGNRLLERRPNAALGFTTNLTAAGDAEILFASGSLHFCPETLAEMLAPLAAKPAHLLINKFPATDLPTFFTLQNMGPAIAPYRISNRAEFLQTLEALGYSVVDTWKTPELSAHIPFHPDESVAAFDGFYLRLRS